MGLKLLLERHRDGAVVETDHAVPGQGRRSIDDHGVGGETESSTLMYVGNTNQE